MLGPTENEPEYEVCVCCVHIKPSFCPTSVHPVFMLLLHPSREIQVLWSQTVQVLWTQTVKQKKAKTFPIHQGKASGMLASPGTGTQQNKPDHAKEKGEEKNVRKKNIKKTSITTIPTSFFLWFKKRKQYPKAPHLS